MTTSSRPPWEPTQWEPRPYQLEGAKFLASHSAAALFAKPGLGKTTMELAAFEALRQAGKVDTALVVAPLLVCYLSWPGEVTKWENFSHLRTVVLHGPHKDDTLKEDADIYLVNHEGLEWLSDNWPREWDRRNWLLVADESTRFKNHDTVRFRTMRGGVLNRRGPDGEPVRKRFNGLLKKFAFRHILTGTPVPRSYEDLWAQFYLVDDGERLGRFISHYRDAYFYKSDDYYNYEIIPGKEEEINAAVADITYHVDDTANIDLPDLVGDAVGVDTRGSEAASAGIREIDLPPKARKAYDELEKDLVTLLEEDLVTAANTGVATAKLRQLANGGIYIGEGEDRKAKEIHLAKAEATLSLVEELAGDPALITYEFHHDLARLRKVLGKKTPVIGKDVSAKEATRILAAWNAGDLPYLVVHPAPVAFGLNIQHGGRAVIFHSLTWNYEHYYQLVKRLWRSGQEERVFLYHLMAKDTIDWAVLGSLRGKASTDAQFLSALRTHYGLAK